MPLAIPTNLIQNIESTSTNYLVRCWKITRTDTIVHRYTEHPHVLTLKDGSMYTPINGWTSSAVKRAGQLEPDVAEVKSAVMEISADALRSGKLVGALVIEYVVDTRWPHLENVETSVLSIRDMHNTGEFYEAEVVGQSSYLEEPAGEYWGPDCRVEVFSAACGLDPADYIKLAQTVDVLDTDEPRRVFIGTGVSVSTPFDNDEYLRYGKLIWVSGNNTGITSDIKVTTNGGLGATYELQVSVPDTIQVGDVYNALPGCNKQPGSNDTDGDCTNKFIVADSTGNLVNFQGEPYIPGDDKTRKGIQFI